ncbi:hypothetical protein AMTR_s00010p00259830 [Amborella trichopoda]|uniref:Uncharacterized protein n=1 Tax=Amborella trichopoda TaxID=13333 RepID=W1NG42_AMBTC|nr:hypothetical protein AMTR_s00010p00259830 [Amborella trichopoda]
MKGRGGGPPGHFTVEFRKFISCSPKSFISYQFVKHSLRDRNLCSLTTEVLVDSNQYFCHLFHFLLMSVMYSNWISEQFVPKNSVAAQAGLLPKKRGFADASKAELSKVLEGQSDGKDKEDE